MKKLVLLLAVVASATLFSCSGNKAANDSTAADTTAQTEDTAATVDSTAATVDSTAAQA